MVSEEPYWICVCSSHNREFKANQALIDAGFQTYLPIRKTDIRNNRKNRTVTSALYPPYLFVRIIPEVTDIHPIKKEVRIIRFGLEPARASDALIAEIKAEEQDGLHISKYRYEKGDLIRMKSGLYKDYQGNIERLTKQDKAIMSELSSGKLVEIKISDATPAEP